ncbi:C-GCAxxG-C-C family (seleno)protein [Halodesulfovibrio marinisediminis]|uniref:Putative redox-active protein (C_GCAxxG_C_C) n=1 Tax=Halodesulfovibrio marinisediminis DSM 17456 TaxID=1121457 RepID=A0A1N6H706_9BACT|nr:C-GCAxxG-C-C family (seleno)protein [Halodesulfovibrio marinisediminis]SIO15608.1 Putative redox-active protein (C_GCAxxG_C_C) [Halodesulfovibrio marinisediminis DSM 17456]
MTLSSENTVQEVLAQMGAPTPADRKKKKVTLETTFPDSPAWQPQPVDSAKAERMAYDGCIGGYGCCYAAFYSIIGQMAEKHGAPYKDFPFHSMKAGRSGIGGWKSTCGALIGAAFAYGMFYEKKEHNELVRELFHWHDITELPVYRPKTNCKLDVDIPSSISGSVLCTTSKARWAYASGFPIKSKECSERCARLTADVARKAVEIFNAKIDGTFVSTVDKNVEMACEVSEPSSEGDAASVILVKQPEFRSVKAS